ncbi:hypothetical protein F4776DRAFT_658672 [Hypoxylon sp. NC0597]|nr:hypothetical protein F4776DRAFT_658672 [Hypoxylon sp. NC0597]
MFHLIDKEPSFPRGTTCSFPLSLVRHVTDVAHSLNIPKGPFRVPIPVKDDLATVTTDITVDRQAVSFDIDVKRATSFLQTPLDSEGNTYLDGDIRDATTRLAYHDGCDNYNTSAVDYLGPPDRIHVRCDDPRKRCGDACNKDPKLRNVIDDVKGPEMGPIWRYDVSTEKMNKAHVWAHELMHIKWVTDSQPYGPNDLVGDFRMWVNIVGEGNGVVTAHVPQPVKGLAHYGADGGIWVLRNADSLALYDSVRYIQIQLGNVSPHLPVAPAAPSNAGIRTALTQTAWERYHPTPPVDTFGSLSHDSRYLGAFPLGTTSMPLDGFVDEDSEFDPAYAINLDTFLNGWYSDLYKANQCVVPSGCNNADLKTVLFPVREELNSIKSRRITWR